MPVTLPRFIVQAHRNLTHKSTRWRTGVLLGAAGWNVLVRRDRDRRRIDIHVTGPAELQRAALNVVLNDLEHVHRLNPKIGAKARVPLPDQPKVSVGYEHLLDMEEKYGPEYELHPEGAERSYAVRELLEGVRRDGQSQVKEERTPVSKIEVNIGDNATFSGDFAVGEKIQNSFNKAGGAGSPEELKTLLQELAEQVAKVAEKLADQEAAEVADDLERFTEEATKDNPRRKWWELSAEGIREAAESVGTVGTTAINLLEKVGGLLAS